MTELAPPFEFAPVPLLVLDEREIITRCNRIATEAGFEAGMALSTYLHPGEPPAAASEEGPRHGSRLFRLTHAEKRYALHRVMVDGECWLWLRDLSEQIALAEQLRALRSPEQKRDRHIYHEVVTAMGYAELLDVIMEDNQVLSSEKMKAVRRYQSEVAASLRRIQHVLSHQPIDAVDRQHSVIVVDTHQDLTDLLTELLQTEGFHVQGFTDADSALKYCALNSGGIYKAVIDDTITDRDNVPLSISLKVMSPETDIVFLTSRDTPGAIQKPVDFQVLLQAMLD